MSAEWRGVSAVAVGNKRNFIETVILSGENRFAKRIGLRSRRIPITRAPLWTSQGILAVHATMLKFVERTP